MIYLQWNLLVPLSIKAAYFLMFHVIISFDPCDHFLGFMWSFHVLSYGHLNPSTQGKYLKLPLKSYCFWPSIAPLAFSTLLSFVVAFIRKFWVYSECWYVIVTHRHLLTSMVCSNEFVLDFVLVWVSVDVWVLAYWKDTPPKVAEKEWFW